MLEAISNGYNYIGIDPLTADRLNIMMKYFNGKYQVIKGCSENEKNEA
jgi:hypothetical protein